MPDEQTLMKRFAGELVNMIILTNARTVTKYLSPTMTLKATRHGVRRANEKTVQMMVTVGRPNYAERAFIKDLKAAGEPFPVKRISIKYPPKKKAGKA